MSKQLLFSVTVADCDWEYMRGTGPGGQKRNKTETKVRCTHRASGATATSDITRSQHDNKRDAFIKMLKTPEYQKWQKLEIARRMGQEVQIEEAVNAAMADEHIRIEYKENGKWITT